MQVEKIMLEMEMMWVKMMHEIALMLGILMLGIHNVIFL